MSYLNDVVTVLSSIPILHNCDIPLHGDGILLRGSGDCDLTGFSTHVDLLKWLQGSNK